MDISQLILHGIKGITRSKPKLRSDAMKEHRQGARDRALKNKRNIGEMNDSFNISMANTVVDATKKPSRLEMLKKWKEARDKVLKEEKAKSKPVFKVSSHVKDDSINKIYSEIKGKKIAKKPPSAKKTELQPLVDKNQKFKPPSNIKPIEFHNAKKKIESVNEKSTQPHYHTRSKARKENMTVEKVLETKKKEENQTGLKKSSKINPPLLVKKSNNQKVKKEAKVVVKQEESKELRRTCSSEHVEEKEVHDEKKEVLQEDEEPHNATSLSMSPDYPIGIINDTVEIKTPSDSVSVGTPRSNKLESHGYISPYVTMSRGKDSARKEYRSRSSMGGFSAQSPEATGPKAAAAYFNNLLDEEIEKIQLKCNQWEIHKDENNPPEEACDMINTAIGQSNLLISKRMQQFRGLIDSCEAQNSDPLVTSKDLHGFWDVLLTQVRNLELRFENLDKLRANAWEEIIPIKKKVVPKKKKRQIKKSGSATSTIKDAINLARKAAKENANPTNTNMNNFDGGFFSIKSPSKDFIVKSSSKNTPSRKSMYQKVLIENNKRTNETSPAVAMMRVSLVAKSIDKWNVTPAKSILKATSKSTTKKSKAVLFVEDVEKSTTLADPVSSPEEKSQRLTKTKLFD